ncbi:MAG: hypothetical protein AVDCRST_MAG41-4504 [uncultured Corynebacteriales bacterium]|uniref:Uncharacterized protein n=1 Tax=uncultured Mycobacteriales bacterium TaxID=581187 RepID=A0A6J4JXN3_9ACTN|nr:MAG: hypothetical protein AVDCRST_MAG41-4504 [uncultured Corynebacteriales bacterium]
MEHRRQLGPAAGVSVGTRSGPAARPVRTAHRSTAASMNPARTAAGGAAVAGGRR